MVSGRGIFLEMQKALSPRQFNIFKTYFGIDGKRLSLDEIGERYSVTSERIRQILYGVRKELIFVFEASGILKPVFLKAEKGFPVSYDEYNFDGLISDATMMRIIRFLYPGKIKTFESKKFNHVWVGDDEVGKKLNFVSHFVDYIKRQIPLEIKIDDLNAVFFYTTDEMNDQFAKVTRKRSKVLDLYLKRIKICDGLIDEVSKADEDLNKRICETGAYLQIENEAGILEDMRETMANFAPNKCLIVFSEKDKKFIEDSSCLSMKKDGLILPSTQNMSLGRRIEKVVGANGGVAKICDLMEIFDVNSSKIEEAVSNVWPNIKTVGNSVCVLFDKYYNGDDYFCDDVCDYGSFFEGDFCSCDELLELSKNPARFLKKKEVGLGEKSLKKECFLEYFYGLPKNCNLLEKIGLTFDDVAL